MRPLIAVIVTGLMSFMATAPVCGEGTTNRPPPLVSSAAGQFNAHTPDAVWSSVLCAQATEVKRHWLRALDLPDGWRDPILLIVRERSDVDRASPGAWLEVLPTDLHLKFQIQLRIPPPLERRQLVAVVMQALCDEYANRKRGFPRPWPAPPASAPLWLVTGLVQSIGGETDRLLPVLRRYAGGGAPPTAEELIGATALPSETADRLRFEAHAWVLVESLLGLPNGPAKLRQLLEETVSPGDGQRAFASVYGWYFPDSKEREKWWSLQLAARSMAMLPGMQDAEQTMRQLAAILPGKLQMQMSDSVAEAPVAFTDLWRYTEKGWLAPMARDKLSRLVALRGVAHPLYVRVIDHYIAAIECLLRQQAGRFRYETKLAEREQAAAKQRSAQLREYIDQMERRYAPADEESVRRQLQLLGATHEADLLRRDPISDYLNKFDR